MVIYFHKIGGACLFWLLKHDFFINKAWRSRGFGWPDAGRLSGHQTNWGERPHLQCCHGYRAQVPSQRVLLCNHDGKSVCSKMYYYITTKLNSSLSEPLKILCLLVIEYFTVVGYVYVNQMNNFQIALDLNFYLMLQNFKFYLKFQVNLSYNFGSRAQW